MKMNNSILAVIPARGGSKGIPRKNIKALGGKPLIAWSIEAAKKAKLIESLIVNTDDIEIAGIARDLGVDVPFLRPKNLSEDFSRSVDVAIDTMRRISGYEWIMWLQPTSPFRSAADIDNSIIFASDNSASSVVSITEVDHPPEWIFSMNNSFNLSPIIEGDFGNRQDLQKYYILNGAIYLSKVSELYEKRAFISTLTMGYKMPRDRSLDIDSIGDWLLAECMIKKAFDK